METILLAKDEFLQVLELNCDISCMGCLYTINKLNIEHPEYFINLLTNDDFIRNIANRIYGIDLTNA